MSFSWQFPVIAAADSLAQMRTPLLVVLFTLIVFTACGLFVFKKRDVS